MKIISWGFIGCGEVTERKSGPAFNEVEGSHIEAVMSRSAEKARSYAQRHGVKKWYTDAQELIDDGRYYLYDCYPTQFADDERVQANRLRRAPQWETFLKYLEGRGKLRR